MESDFGDSRNRPSGHCHENSHNANDNGVSSRVDDGQRELHAFMGVSIARIVEDSSEEVDQIASTSGSSSASDADGDEPKEFHAFMGVPIAEVIDGSPSDVDHEPSSESRGTNASNDDEPTELHAFMGVSIAEVIDGSSSDVDHRPTSENRGTNGTNDDEPTELHAFMGLSIGEIGDGSSSVPSPSESITRMRASNVVESLSDVMQIPTASTVDEEDMNNPQTTVVSSSQSENITNDDNVVENDDESDDHEWSDAMFDNEDDIANFFHSRGQGVLNFQRMMREAILEEVAREDFDLNDRKEYEAKHSVKCPLCSELFWDYTHSNHPNAAYRKAGSESLRCSHGAISVFTTLHQCPICFEENIEPPNVIALPCGHLICREDFTNLGGFNGEEVTNRPRGKPSPLAIPSDAHTNPTPLSARNPHSNDHSTEENPLPNDNLRQSVPRFSSRRSNSRAVFTDLNGNEMDEDVADASPDSDTHIDEISRNGATPIFQARTLNDSSSDDYDHDYQYHAF